MVLYLGRLAEVADGETLFKRPRHPYTRALIEAVPVADPLSPGGRMSVRGEVPSILEPPPGCAFHPRCSMADARCRADRPGTRRIGGSAVACHHAD